MIMNYMDKITQFTKSKTEWLRYEIIFGDHYLYIKQRGYVLL